MLCVSCVVFMAIQITMKDYQYLVLSKHCKAKQNAIIDGVLQMSRPVTKPTKCAPSEDSDQPGHPPSLIRVFAVRSVGS